MAAKSDEDVVIVKRIGNPLLYGLGFLLSASSLLFVLHSILHGRGWGRFFPYAALVSCVCLCCFLYKALPGNTIVDMKNRTVLVRPSGWKTETIPFDEVCDIRTFTRGAAVGYCLLLRDDPLFGCVAISDPTTESAYIREIGLQVVPRIKAALPGAAGLPAAGQICFEGKGDGWEQRVPDGFQSGRNHALAPDSRTLEISGGILFQRKSQTFSLDNLEALCVKVDRKTKKSVYFRFKGEKHLHLAAHDTPDKLREILASYALVMGVDLSGKIEYIS